MRPATALLPLATGLTLGLSLLLLSGCGDSVYYQTRYAPTSSEQSFGAGERLFWSESRETYELPANPPAYDTEPGYDDHRQRIDCAATGQRFKAQSIAAIGPDLSGPPGRVDGQTIAVLGPPSGIPPAPPAGPGQRMVRWGDDVEQPPLDHRPAIKVGATDARAQPPLHSGTGLREPDKLAGWHEDRFYCPPER